MRAIVQAARVSYGRRHPKAPRRCGLIRYLMRHWHSTPFEMCEIKLHVKLPIFVARQWIRHRTANVNEYSARYSILDREFYIPAPEHLAAQSTSNRQGRGAGAARGGGGPRARDPEGGRRARLRPLRGRCSRAEGQQGLARELARMNLPQNVYTQWYWKIDLHNLLPLPAAARRRPRPVRDPRLCRGDRRDRRRTGCRWPGRPSRITGCAACSFRRKAWAALKRMLRGRRRHREQSGMSRGEWREFESLLRG
ncbi:MAG: flavin-dependent thymidylate synthase [Paracoccaceae bacterium]|nr:MAG: flavin-dependent thymidylate synthase [Paracoccaceae bacterium]